MGKPTRSTKNEPLGFTYLLLCVSKLELLTWLYPLQNDHILFLVDCYLKTSFNYLKSSSSTKLAIFLLF